MHWRAAERLHALDAAQEDVDLLRRTLYSRHAPAPRSSARNAPEKLRRILATIASSYLSCRELLKDLTVDRSTYFCRGSARTPARPTAHLDYLAVAPLAFPFMVNSAVQAVLNATDTWFIGRVSPTATAAIGAVYWPVLVLCCCSAAWACRCRPWSRKPRGAPLRTRLAGTWTALWAALVHGPDLHHSGPVSGRALFAPFGFRTTP